MDMGKRVIKALELQIDSNSGLPFFDDNVGCVHMQLPNFLKPPPYFLEAALQCHNMSTLTLLLSRILCRSSFSSPSRVGRFSMTLVKIGKIVHGDTLW
jgi:hypothetical protein